MENVPDANTMKSSKELVATIKPVTIKCIQTQMFKLQRKVVFFLPNKQSFCT